MASTQTSSPVLHGRRRASARLREKTVLLEADGVRRRIPVAAIERVVVHGAGGRRLPVVLTGDERRRRLGRVRRMAAVLGRLDAAYAGVTVEGRLQSSHWSGDVKQYAYVDSREARCERTGAEGGA